MCDLYSNVAGSVTNPRSYRADSQIILNAKLNTVSKSLYLHNKFVLGL